MPGAAAAFNKQPSNMFKCTWLKQRMKKEKNLKKTKKLTSKKSN